MSVLLQKLTVKLRKEADAVFDGSSLDHLKDVYRLAGIVQQPVSANPSAKESVLLNVAALHYIQQMQDRSAPAVAEPAAPNSGSKRKRKVSQRVSSTTFTK